MLIDKDVTNNLASLEAVLFNCRDFLSYACLIWQFRMWCPDFP